MLDPFAGSGTTLVQSLESGHDAIGVDIAGFNCLLMRVKTRRHNLDAIRRDLVWAHERPRRSRPTGRCPRTRRRTCAPGTRRGPRPSCSTSGRSSTRSRPPTCFASSSPAPRARRAARPTSTSTSRGSPQVEPYWCHKHRRTCRPVEEARRFLLRYTLDTLDRIESFAAVRADGAPRVRSARRRPGARARRPVRRRRHVAAVPGADRLPRAAPLRLRAARARRASRARARPSGPRRRPGGDPGVRRGGRRRPRATLGGAWRRGAPVCIVVNDRRDLLPGDPAPRAGFASRIGSSATSTAVRDVARASTSSRCSSARAA